MAHYESYQELLRSATPVKGVPLKKKESTEVNEPEPVSEENQPELAKSNRWIKLTDGSIVEVKRGEELPAEELREKNSTQKEFQEWQAAQPADADDDWTGDDTDEGDA